jgi:DNA-directed RNA polymerase specialized sigma24 family protein
MNGHEVFQQKFDALDVSTRAALVFRYREGLPLAHVAQLVDRPVRKLGPQLDRTLAEFRDAGALTASEDPARAVSSELDELRGDPALSSFSLVKAVRAERNRRGLLRGRMMGRFA